MKPKHRIKNGNIEESTDGGKTWKFVQTATPAEIKSYQEAQAKKQTTPAKPKGPGATVSPYGDEGTQAFLQKFGINPEDMNYSRIGHQPKETLGLTDKEIYDKWRKGNPKFIADFEKDGSKFDPNNPEHMKSYEKFHRDYTYNGIYNALVKQGTPEAEAKTTAEDATNKLSFVDKAGVVNAADQQWGNFHRTRKEFKFPDPEEAPKAAPKPREAPSAGPQRQEVRPYTAGRQDSPWWLQDIINTASAAGTRLGLKKYMPWSPQVQMQTPRPTFFDPTRELAANMEQMQIGTEGAGLFSGPQAYNARFAQIQGSGAKNAANILSQYHNKNVGVANQFENLRANIYNQNNQLNANVAKRLYDQSTIANQQFDNAKRQANNELRASYVNAITNRAQTQTLNTMYPNYQVDPSTGGFLDFYKGTEMQPNEQTGAIDRIDELMAKGWSRSDALDFLGYGSGKRSTVNTNIYQNPAYIAHQEQMQSMGSPMIGPGYGSEYYD